MSPKEECEVLMNELLPIGVDFIKKHGEFYPYGSVMNMDETITLMEFYEGNEFPSAKDIFNGLKDACKKLAIDEKIKACGIVSNASVFLSDGVESDAIIISLEHKEKYSVKVALPYKVGFLKRVKFGNLIALEGDKNIF